MKKTYAQKRKENGADSYGTWREGVQVRAEYIAGTPLVYDARKGVWK